MAARAMWSGSITFGLVNIPVRMYNAVSPKDVQFHLLHDTDGVRIKQKRVCPADGQEVTNEHLIKGYEISKNRYVTIRHEELEGLDPKRTHTIEIGEFVPADQINPLYYEHPYYLSPDRGANKAYALLREAMARTGKVGIATVVLRTKQYLVALRPNGDALTMCTLFYADEVVPAESLEGLPGDVKLQERELVMAEQLIESLTTRFDPAKYRNEYREKVLALIEKKAQGQEVVIQPPPPEAPKVIDLMAALEASLAKVSKPGGSEAAKKSMRRQKAS